MEIKSFKNKKYFKLAQGAANFVGSFYVIMGGLAVIGYAVYLLISLGHQPIIQNYPRVLSAFFNSIVLFAMGLVIHSASKLFETLVKLIEEAEKTI